MHIDTRNEYQFRVLSGMWAFPELFRTTPQYLTGDEPYLTIRRALEAYHAEEIEGYELLMGMFHKYGDPHFTELIRVLENALAVPCKRWAESQIKIFDKLLTQDYEREPENAA